MHNACPSLRRFKDLDLQIRTHMNAATRLQLSAGMNHRLVSVVSEWFQQQQLSWSARIASAEQSSMEYASRVEDYRVARRNKIGEIAKCPVFNRPGLSMNHHQPALITALGRNLRYLIGREVKVVVIGSASVSDQNREGCDPFDGIVKPKCRYACAVAIRPRGVRWRNPFWTRKGS